MTTNIAAQMLGLVDYRLAEPLERTLTTDERDLAIEIGYEIAEKHGIDLASHVAAHNQMLLQLAREHE